MVGTSRDGDADGFDRALAALLSEVRPQRTRMGTDRIGFVDYGPPTIAAQASFMNIFSTTSRG